MLALSTAWLSSTLDDGLQLIDRCKDLECISTIELDYRLNDPMVDLILMVVRAGEFGLSSIHAPCPAPAEFDRLTAHAELQLADADREKRAWAVAAVERSIDLAAELEVPTVITHLGLVEVPGEIDGLRKLFDADRIDTEEAAEVRADLLERREGVVAPYLDAALFSLDYLIECARRRGIFLALENRAAFYELPNATELELIFDEFRGSQLRFWYDAGNAAVQENLGWTTQQELLETHHERLCGVHLHDAVGYTNRLIDEKRQTDYRLMRNFVHPEAQGQVAGEPAIPCVIEVENVEEEQLLEYIEFLAAEGFVAD